MLANRLRVMTDTSTNVTGNLNMTLTTEQLKEAIEIIKKSPEPITKMTVLYSPVAKDNEIIVLCGKKIYKQLTGQMGKDND